MSKQMQTAQTQTRRRLNRKRRAKLPKTVLTFRTEQIYIADANGNDVKPLTQNEGLIYFYFVWSPDSSMLASLAATYQEWNFLQYQADGKGEFFVPMGRPRLIEKNGRERRLDDNLTSVHPVWSPDSAKVAALLTRKSEFMMQSAMRRRKPRFRCEINC